MEIHGYSIAKVLGSGGMATVYLGTQESFGRKVAIKVLSSNLVADEEFATRFLREARIVAQLSHPHIIPVYDVGQCNCNFYMSMDYLAGGDLSRWIKAGLEEPEVVQITVQIAQALHYAHSKGYVHRDIKPDNIMFREDNSAVLTDFGIACLRDAGDGLTQVGTVVGTPKYMSPEQLQGEEIDGRADIYSLGIVFYEMLMKEPPYQASNFTALSLKHIQDPIPTLPPRFSHYQSFLEKFIAKNREQRFQHGLEIVKALKVLETGRAGADKPAVVDVQILAAEQTGTEPTPAQKKKARPAPATTATPAPESSPQKKAIQQAISFEEKSVRKIGLLKRYVLSCNLATDDVHHFTLLFSRTTTRILDWHSQHKSKCGTIEFNITGERWVFKRARELINNLYEGNEPFQFVKKLTITVNFLDVHGKGEESFTLG